MAPRSSTLGTHSSTLDDSLEIVACLLHQAAADLDAEAAAVLLTSGPQTDVSYLWSVDGMHGSRRPFAQAEWTGLDIQWGPVDAGNRLAGVLRECVSPDSQSFLTFPTRVNRQVATVVFGFAAPTPPEDCMPAGLAENMQLIGFAAWSAREIERLRAELRTVTSRLAGRKLVERAKGVLQEDQGLTEKSAYEYLRGQSRRRRITLAALAQEIVRGHDAGEPISQTSS